MHLTYVEARELLSFDALRLSDLPQTLVVVGCLTLAAKILDIPRRPAIGSQPVVIGLIAYADCRQLPAGSCSGMWLGRWSWPSAASASQPPQRDTNSSSGGPAPSDQPDAASVHAQYDRLVEAVHHKLPQVAAHLDAARPDVLAFTSFPKEIWRQIWSNNPWVILSPKGGRGCGLGCFVRDSVLGEAG